MFLSEIGMIALNKKKYFKVAGFEPFFTKERMKMICWTVLINTSELDLTGL